MKKFKLKKVKAAMLEGVKQAIDSALTERRPADDSEALLFACLKQLSDKIYSKLGNWQQSYSISLAPAEALALRLFFVDYINDRSSYLGNQLGIIADGVHQYYQ